ncbi:SIS domain-containing protein [Chloroflexota bacterium]
MSVSYFDEVKQQPAVLRDAVSAFVAQEKALSDWLGAIHETGIQRVVMTAMGSSYNACYPALLQLIEHGITAILVDTSEMLYYQQGWFTADTLLIAVSQSGESVEMVKLLADCPADVPILGVTNTPASTLAQRANFVIEMHAGEEKTVSTKTYTTSLAVLTLLACVMTKGDLAAAAAGIRQVADKIEQTLPIWEEQLSKLVLEIADSRFFAYLGRGPSLASAQMGALIAKESAKIPTQGCSVAHFRHGPIEMVEPGVCIVLFSGAPATREINLLMAEELARLGGTVILIGHIETVPANVISVALPDADDGALPLLEAIPVQLLAGHLAEARGIPAGTFRYIGKVTNRE